MFWLFLGIVLITIETMTLSLDFLALGVAALGTAAVLAIIGPSQTRLIAVIIFSIFSVIALYRTKIYLAPRKKKHHSKHAMTKDNIIGYQAIVQFINGKKVISYQGNYYLIENSEEQKEGETVTIKQFRNNKVVIEK